MKYSNYALFCSILVYSCVEHAPEPNIFNICWKPLRTHCFLELLTKRETKNRGKNQHQLSKNIQSRLHSFYYKSRLKRLLMHIQTGTMCIRWNLPKHFPAFSIWIGRSTKFKEEKTFRIRRKKIVHFLLWNVEWRKASVIIFFSFFDFRKVSCITWRTPIQSAAKRNAKLSNFYHFYCADEKFLSWANKTSNNNTVRHIKRSNTRSRQKNAMKILFCICNECVDNSPTKKNGNNNNNKKQNASHKWENHALIVQLVN